MVAAAAATSILSLCGSSALADTSAEGNAKESPGVLAGNKISAPIEVPVNVCGNTVDAASALNPSFGNDCAKGGVQDPDRANMLLGIALKRKGDKAAAMKAFDAVKDPKFVEVAKLWKTAAR